MPAWKPIPGETPIDPSGLRDTSIRNRKQLNEAEGRNIASAIFTYLIGELTPEMAPFDFVWALQLHKEMFGEVWTWAGIARKIDLNLGVPWQQVETQLYDLLQRLPYWKDMPLMEQAGRLHHRAVAIHPFENGNGRWSRMLANIWLKRQGGALTIWPEEAVGSSSVIREEYLEVVKAADRMDFALLVALHARYTAASQP